MGAKPSVEGDVTRLIEAADEIASAQHGSEHGGGIARMCSQIAVPQFGRRKERRSAREVEHNIAVRCRAVPRRRKDERTARGRPRYRIIVDNELECAKMALCGADRPFDDRKLGGTRRDDLVGLL